MTSLSRLRKRPLEGDAEANVGATDEIDITGCATVAYSSEDPAHPVEHLLDGNSGPGATRWISARPDTTEHVLVEFDQPHAISRLVYEVEEAERERSQEVRVEVSEDAGRTYRQILVQEYTFSPRGATYQREEQRFNLENITHLRLADRAKQAWFRYRIAYRAPPLRLSVLVYAPQLLASLSTRRASRAQLETSGQVAGKRR
jgi:hypothetical protein